MNYKNTGAAKHHPLSARKTVAGQGHAERHLPFPSLLSTMELRRLVAAMVD